jgi:twitching motility protein PilT
MQTFDQALLAHFQAGRVAMADAVRVASSPHDFKLLVAADGKTSTSMDDLDQAVAASEETVQEAAPPSTHSGPGGPAAPSAPAGSPAPPPPSSPGPGPAPVRVSAPPPGLAA